MTLVPGSHRYGLLSVETADTSISFTDQQVVLPEGTLEPIRADMQPGDGLFWDGKIVPRLSSEYHDKLLASEFHLSFHQCTRQEVRTTAGQAHVDTQEVSSGTVESTRILGG